MKALTTLAAGVLVGCLVFPGAAMSQQQQQGGQPDVLRGGPGNDLIIGSEERDIIIGGSGDDVLRGRGGADMIEGGPGADQLEAQEFEETYGLTDAEGGD